METINSKKRNPIDSLWDSMGFNFDKGSDDSVFHNKERKHNRIMENITNNNLGTLGTISRYEIQLFRI